MFSRTRTPLAWLQLIHNIPRLLGSMSGVAFAVVLMFLELGFLNGLFDSQTYVVEMMNADLILTHVQKEAVTPTNPFPRRRLHQALGHEHVQAGYPVYMEGWTSVWKSEHRGHRNVHAILVYGINPEDPVFQIPEVVAQQHKLKVANAALIDTASKDLFGSRRPGSEAELTLQKIRVVGTFPLGPDLRIDGNLIVSKETFFKYLANPTAGVDPRLIEMGLLQVTPGADVHKVRDELNARLPDDVRVWTKQEFLSQVRKYWAELQPVGLVFGMGTVVGFLIGVTICYQILYNDIMDHAPQYATLKAIGYPNRFLIKIVLQEAIYLAVLGFLPGLFFSFLGYATLQYFSGILMKFTWFRVGLIFVLTVLMCVVSGLLAIGRVLRADPTEVF